MQTNGWLMAAKYAGVTLWAYVIQFMMPIWPMMVAVMVLVVVDLYTGVKAARYRGEIIASGGYKRSVTKITLYLLSLLITEMFSWVFLKSKGINFDLTWVTALVIALTELKSNLENVYEVTGVDIWSKIAEHIPDFLPKKKKDNE